MRFGQFGCRVRRSQFANKRFWRALLKLVGNFRKLCGDGLGRLGPLLHAVAERAQHRGEILAREPVSDVMFTVTVKPPPSIAPGGFGAGEPARHASAGRIRSASRSRISTRTARSPHTR